MEARAIARGVRISPRKVRLVVDLIRGKGLEEARAILKFLPKRGALPVSKVLNSAAANAVNRPDSNLLEDALVITAAYVDEGPSLKRVLPRARGQAHIIKKRTSHITIVVGEKNGK